MSNSKNNDIKSNIIKLANELLQICHNEHDDTARSRSAGATLSQTVPKQISSISQLKSNAFVFIYENICNTELIGI